MESHGLGLMNGNNERFPDMCAANKLAIGGRLFRPKATWVSPDYVTTNQIDQICKIQSLEERFWGEGGEGGGEGLLSQIITC